MYCSHCGNQIHSDSSFCSKCGKATQNSQAPIMAAEKEALPKPILAFGVPITRWWLKFFGPIDFPAPYSWVTDLNTLLVCRDYLVLLRGEEKRNAALDVVQSMGIVGGLIGAARNAKDSLLNKKLELGSDHASRLAEDGLLLWCKKSEAAIWRYREKPSMFIKSSSEQLYCPFVSKVGVLHACAVLWCTEDYTGSGKGDIDGIGCRIEDVAQNLPSKQVKAAMEVRRKQLPLPGAQ